ncbi:hypothetical protein FQN55_006895 [Onygenales sp. PD_40]|nr:hypothetical protein FQN55_006895 [Onygenales sp. PD_40]
MDTNRRRQNRSCDQCRHGKKACDAAIREPHRREPRTGNKPNLSPSLESSNSSAPSDNTDSCSNCKRWKKECTFTWLHSLQPRENRKSRRRKKAAATPVPQGDKVTQLPLRDISLPLQLPVAPSLTDIPILEEDFPQPYDPPPRNRAPDSLASTVSCPESADTEWTGIEATGAALSGWDVNSANLSLIDGDSSSSSGSLPGFWNGAPSSVSPIFDGLDQLTREIGLEIPDQEPFDTGEGYMHISGDQRETRQRSYSISTGNGKQPHPFLSSSDLADGFARSTVTQSFFRIYHDSLENALSCWLTEQNCPYSNVAGPRGGQGNNMLLEGVIKEWGPNWSNRICMRVCRLDRSYTATLGRRLSDREEKMASRALHTAIMAFASQWAHDHEGKMRHLRSQMFPMDDSERGVQRELWNQARNNLHESVGIPSFRVAFANIIFSLTQPSLDVGEHIRNIDCTTVSGDSMKAAAPTGSDVHTASPSGVAELDDLIENDRAPLFLDAAIRQLFAFRYRLTRCQRQKPTFAINRTGNKFPKQQYLSVTPPSQQIENLSQSPPQEFVSTVPTNSLSLSDNETFNLLLWLGVMFDTLTAVMYQRPVVISDEDSQITSIRPSSTIHGYHEDEVDQIDLDGWSIGGSQRSKNKRKDREIWGDLFLERSALGPMGSCVPRWPCSHEAAAKTLSDMAPVKVLLFRRVSRLQTLVYRCAEPECLEQAIQDTLRVYHHWNCTYRRFLLDCIANHDNLPPRIQSWYVILAAHWHLAAMLLADTLDSIDQAHLGQESQRETRQVMSMVSTLRRDNTLAVCSLAECSLPGMLDPQTPKGNRTGGSPYFHDSLDQGSFLTEPWTVVLIRSFTKAGSIILEEIDTSPSTISLCQNGYSDHARRQCEFCIDALCCLGRKSDMAFVAAQALAKSLERRLMERDVFSFL